MTIASAWRDVRNGVRNGYPPCCVVIYSLNNVRHVSPQYIQRGVRHYPHHAHIPCGIIHKGIHV